MALENSEIESLKHLRRKAEKKGNLKESAKLSNEIGVLLSFNGEYEDSIEEHLEALNFHREENNLLAIANDHRHIGESYSKLNNYDKALYHHKAFLRIAIDIKNKIEEQRAHATLGNTHFQQAERLQSEAANIHTFIDECEECLKYAEENFNIALRLCEELKLNVDMKEYLLMKARLFTNLGLVSDLRLNGDMCISYFKRAIAITEKLNLQDDLYLCQFNLSGFYHRICKLKDGLRYVDDAVRTASHIKDKGAERDALLLKAKMYVDCDNLELSKKLLTKAYKMKIADAENLNIEIALKKVIKLIHLDDDINECPRGNHLQLMNIHEKIGDIAASMNCYISALKHYKLMEENAALLGYTCEKLLPVLVSIEQTYRDLRKYEEAFQYLMKQLSCCNQTDYKSICRYKLDMTFLYRLLKKPIFEIKKLYEEAYQAAFQSDNIFLQIHTLNCLYKYLVKNQITDSKSDEAIKDQINEICVRNNISVIPDSFDFDGEADNSSNNDVNDESIDVVGDIDLREELDSSSEDDIEKVVFSDRKKLDKKNQLGETPLHRACISGNYKKVLSLLDEGHPINPRDNCGWLPLHEAANHGHSRVVALLLDRGGRINDRGGDKCGGITPLHDACNCGNLEVVELLIDRGCDVMIRDDEGKTALDALREYKSNAKSDFDLNELIRIEKKLCSLNAQANSVQYHSTKNNKKLSKSNANNNAHYDALNKTKLRLNNKIFCIENQEDDLPRKKKPKGKEMIKLYKKTIDDLKSGRRSSKFKRNFGNRNIPALLPEEDAITEDWMIVDQGVLEEPNTMVNKSSEKKRKVSEEFYSLKKMKISRNNKEVNLHYDGDNLHNDEDYLRNDEGYLRKDEENLRIDEDNLHNDNDNLHNDNDNLRNDEDDFTNALYNSLLDDDENYIRAINNSLLDDIGENDWAIVKNGPDHLGLNQPMGEDIDAFNNTYDKFNNSSLNTSNDAVSQLDEFNTREVNNFKTNKGQIFPIIDQESIPSKYIYDYCENRHNIINHESKINNKNSKIWSNKNTINNYMDKLNKAHANDLSSINSDTSLKSRINRNIKLKNTKINNFLKSPQTKKDSFIPDKEPKMNNYENKASHNSSNFDMKKNIIKEADNFINLKYTSNKHLSNLLNHKNTNDFDCINSLKSTANSETFSNILTSKTLNSQNKVKEGSDTSKSVNKEDIALENKNKKFLKLLKIKIQDEIIALPIYDGDDEETVSWLCMEASKRYSQLFQRKPKISLMLKDGANLAPMDSIQWILQEDLILSRVIEWQVENIESKYIETCAILQLTAYSNIRKYLVASEKNSILSLKDLALSSAHFKPIALSLQNNITQLHLQGNKLCDEGLSMLLEGLNNLSNIEILNLSSNFITYSGITKFKEFILSFSPECRPLQKLNSLDLSCNNITGNLNISIPLQQPQNEITNSPLITSTIADSDASTSSNRFTIIEKNDHIDFNNRYYKENRYNENISVDSISGYSDDTDAINSSSGYRSRDSCKGVEQVSDLWSVVCMLKLLSKLELNSCKLIDDDLILPRSIKDIKLTHIDLSLNAFTSSAISRIFNLLDTNVFLTCFISSPINDMDLDIKTVFNEAKNFNLFVDGVLLKTNGSINEAKDNFI